MLTDEQFGRRLGDQLRHETAGVRADPNLGATLRRRQVRRTWTVRSAVAAAAVAVAAVAVVATTAGRGGPEQTVAVDDGTPTPSSTAAPTSTEEAVLSAAYVRAATIEALGNAADYVIFSKTTYDSGYYDTWTDKSTKRYRNDVYTTLPALTTEPGDRSADDGPELRDVPRGPMRLQQSHAAEGPPGDRKITSVDYDKRWWSVSPEKVDLPTSAIGLDVTDQDSVREAISDGTAELLGHEEVNGIDTLHLRVIGSKREFRLDLWVDSKSYLPIKEDLVKSSGPGPNEFSPEHNVATTYEWLPRTEENLKFLTLTPPADFKRIP
jgi:hypothetical protein